ncbi:C-type mannose receptor 2-like [Thalassophryne amazonica]|uniref:C-type mannose receptor 2-like n=1 Tax=Thalassophryne amazonica TaxID=390379 RepID=UPI0014714401|nr:C-type mannose receptor 2-like [Thalassophryne amazonica]
MDYGLVIFVLAGTLVRVGSAQSRQYFLVSEPRNWTEAQSFCRHVYTDLATIENSADVTAVNMTASNYTGKAWIGLYVDLYNSWKWSLNDSSFYGPGEMEFRNWYTAQPNNLGGQQHCVILLSWSVYFGTWDDTDCSSQHFFVCYNGTVNGNVSFVLVEILKNWADAQLYCREHFTDLASVRNQTENDLIANISGDNFVWIGLYRQNLWSDGSTSLFCYWNKGQPDHATVEETCVTSSFADSGRWSDDNCSLSFPFICYITIPPKAEGFRSIGQNETSIMLQWLNTNSTVSYIVQYDEHKK